MKLSPCCLATGVSHGLHPGEGRPIQQGDLLALHPELRLAHPCARQSGKQVLHGGQLALAQAQGGAEAGVTDLGRGQTLQALLGGRQPADPVPLLAGGLETDPTAGATVEAHPRTLHGGGKGVGQAVVRRPDAH
jgi:hypothetical protein